MENETRQSRQQQGMKTATKVAIGVCLVLVAIGTGALAAMMINKGDSAVQKESTQSTVSLVESEKSKSDEQSTGVEQQSAAPSTKVLAPSTDVIEKVDGYSVVLNFADGTRRLSKYVPTYEAWERTTSSPASNGHLGRTNYNQKSFKQLGGVPSNGVGTDTRTDEMKQFNEKYDADSRIMMQNSIEYYQ